MALKDGEMHAVSIFSTVVLTASLFVPVLFFTNAAEATGPVIDKMEQIEASIAYRKTPQKQPQKKFKAPEPVDKPDTLSRDDKKLPTPKKDDPKKPDPKPDDKNPFDKFKHASDDDDPTGKPTTKPGDFNGNEQGYAEETKGDPWLGKLRGDMQYAPPEISRGDSSPVGCIHLTPEGKIADTKFINTTNDDLQTSAENALKLLAKTRNANPDPVPTHLLSLTTKWLCFKFTVKAQ